MDPIVVDLEKKKKEKNILAVIPAIILFIIVFPPIFLNPPSKISMIIQYISIFLLIIPPFCISTRIHENLHRIVMESYGAKCKITYNKRCRANISGDVPFTPKQYLTISLAPLLAAIAPIVLLKLWIFPFFSMIWLISVIAGCGGDFIAAIYSIKFLSKNVLIYDQGTMFTITEKTA